MDEAGDEQRGVPWASLLDPVANARALADVQALGLRAAGELVERFVRPAENDGRPAEHPNGRAADGREPPAADAGRLLEVWMELLRTTAETFGRAVDPAARAADPSPGGVRIDVATGSASGALRIELDRQGSPLDGSAEVWLHNDTAASVGPLALHSGELRSPEGALLPVVIAFEPALITELPARSSRGVALCMGPTAELAAGTYRTVVQAEGAPDVWLPMEVVVQDGAP
jgi:hypothetical protein